MKSLSNFNRLRHWNRKRGFYSLLRKHNRSAMSLLVLEILIDHADDRGIAFVSDSTIADEIGGASRNTIASAREVLKSVGAVIMLDAKDVDGIPDVECCVYLLTGVAIDTDEPDIFPYLFFTSASEMSEGLEIIVEHAQLLSTEHAQLLSTKIISFYEDKETHINLTPLELLEPVKENDTPVIVQSTGEYLLDRERVLEYIKRHAQLKWFKVNDVQYLVEGQPYNSPKVFYTRPQKGHVIRARSLDGELWILCDSHTFLAHFSPHRKPGQSPSRLPFNDKTLYPIILRQWSKSNPQLLNGLDVHKLYKFWQKTTNNGDVESLKWFPSSPAKLLKGVNSVE